jgi:cyclin H
MTEDEIYRASTQYRLWNFTPEILAERRTKTNALAIHQVRAAFKRKKELADTSATPSEAEGNGTNGAAKVENEVACLTPEEEQNVVAYICHNLLELVMDQKHLGNIPIHVAVRERYMWKIK